MGRELRTQAKFLTKNFDLRKIPADGTCFDFLFIFGNMMV